LHASSEKPTPLVMPKLFLLLFCFVICATVNAGNTIDTAALKKLYAVLLDRQPDESASGYRWPHRAILYKVLGIDRSAPDSVVALRMKLGWQQLADMRISEDNEPKLYFHDLLQASLHHRYGVLLLDAVRWGVDLNYMDHAEQKTLINHMEDEYRNNTSLEDAEWLREYKKILLAGDAKYFVELNFYMRQLARTYNRVRPPLYRLFPVEKNGKWGWVTQERKTIVPLRYKAIRRFTDQLFEVSDDGKNFYFIDRKGNRKAID
jgi:hypothetical protein